MRLIYEIDGAKKVAFSNNEDFEFRFENSSNRFRTVLVVKKDMKLRSADTDIHFHANFKDLYFFNGYQSWTDTAEYPLAKQHRDIRKSPQILTKMYAFDRYGDAPFYRYSIRKSHGYDIFYAKGGTECFLYSLNYKNAYLIIEIFKDSHRIHLVSDVNHLCLKKGDEFPLFDYRFILGYEAGLKQFHEDFPRLEKEKIFGYTSWYNYYQNINEEIILRDCDALDSRFNIFQIDDGYETFVGDWLDVDSKKFPRGLAPIVETIHNKGFKAGIWLAPFVAEEKSKLFKEHPEYFAKDAKGRPIKTGCNWSGHYALDIYNDDAMAYVKKCLRHYLEMGFDFFKLDFLYGIAIATPKGETRAQLQQRAYAYLREILEDKLILGCGANIASSSGNFDYLRIGPDVSLKFDDVFYMRFFHRERISTKVTLQNTIYRHLFNDRLFANDPDVFLLRDDNIELSKQQRRALTLINALFGHVLMTSDNIATYDEEKKAVLSHGLDLFQHAENVRHKTEGKNIHIYYELKGEQHEFVYNTKKGVFVYER